jgi:hypothetical protein
MRYLLLIVLCSIPAAEAKVDLRPKHQKVEDPGSATPLLYKTPQQTEALKPSAKASGKITASCTDRFGTVVKQGDKGYETCLRNLDRSKIQNANEKNPNSVGITFGN